MDNTYPELVLCGKVNECAGTDTVFFPISEVSKGSVSLPEAPKEISAAKIVFRSARPPIEREFQ